ncbi:hypothetical protein BGX21_006449, partial [Mortierella sp. AD011]
MKATLLLASLAIAAVASAAGQTYLEETFSQDTWEDRWTTSESRDDLGKFELSSGTFYPNKEYAQGLKTTQDHRFYSISTPFSSVLDNSKDDFVVQYTVKQEISQECGGSYLKLLPEGYDAKTFNGDSEYAIMFGPDVCGAQNRVHVIFNYKGKNYLTKKEFPVPRDAKTHLYRLTVHPDQKYSLVIDGDVMVDHVSIEEHWDVYPPRTIPDPEEKKPEDWVDLKEIEDVTHVKPENYDSIPRYIPDPEAVQPEDWDVESDGDWEAPEIPNPEFEEWTPKYIPNPEYKGEWKAAEVPNPEFKEDADLAHYKIGGVEAEGGGGRQGRCCRDQGGDQEESETKEDEPEAAKEEEEEEEPVAEAAEEEIEVVEEAEAEAEPEVVEETESEEVKEEVKETKKETKKEDKEHDE